MCETSFQCFINHSFTHSFLLYLFLYITFSPLPILHWSIYSFIYSGFTIFGVHKILIFIIFHILYNTIVDFSGHYASSCFLIFKEMRGKLERSIIRYYCNILSQYQQHSSKALDTDSRGFQFESRPGNLLSCYPQKLQANSGVIPQLGDEHFLQILSNSPFRLSSN